MGSSRSPHLIEDYKGFLQLYSDGSVHRPPVNLNFPAIKDPSVEWKDCLYDETHNLHLRLYKPTGPTADLPILFYFHGGGFCFGSFAWPNHKNCCLRLAAALGALVVAPDYRLSPEHRLPAAVDDATAALRWLQAQAVEENGCEEWLKSGKVDFGRVFVLGDSSGGNIAHQMAVKLGAGSPELRPVRMKAYVLLAPFFGGVERTKSEAEGRDEEFFNLELLDQLWRLSLPAGSTRDSPLANPFGQESSSLENVALDPMLVVVGGDEIMRDRIVDYAERLKEQQKKVELVELEGMQHGFFTKDPCSQASVVLLQKIKQFMLENSSG